MKKTHSALVLSSKALAVPEVLESSSSHSRLNKLYSSVEFKLDWDNEMPFHVAQNALHLRHFREMAQVDVARAMGTSQSKVARIEGADENITLKTLKRLASALRGRIRFAIEPREVQIPHLPAPWWDLVGTGLVTDGVWEFHSADSRLHGATQGLVMRWTTEHDIQLTGDTPPVLLLTTSSDELT